MRTRKWFIESICGLLALLFVYTAASKLLDFHQFQSEVRNQAFSKTLDPFIVYGLPPAELLIAAMLLVPATRPAALYAFIALMTLFTAYVALVTFHFYDRVPCSCAGVFRHMGWPAHLVFNVVFTALAVWMIRLHVYINKNIPGQSA